MFRTLRALALLSTLTLTTLRAADPPEAPILRLELGMHTAMVNRIAVDPSGTLLATASDDKSLRVWDMATGQLRSVLRPPIGPGSEGMLFACAWSPDGKTLAAGGWTGYGWDESDCVYLFDVASGTIRSRLTGLADGVDHLAYAPDGRLAVCLNSEGIRVFRPDGTEAFRDTDYDDSSYGADFDHSGRLVTTSQDGFVRCYDAEGRLQAKVATGGDPKLVRFSPDGSKVAVGFHGEGKVELRSGLDLSLLAGPDTSGADLGLSTVAWSLDGQTLYAAGAYSKNGFCPIRAWTHEGRGPRHDYAVARATVMDMAALPGGRMAWGSSDPAWGILDGRSRFSTIADFRGGALTLDATGTTVSFTHSLSGARATFSTVSRQLLQPPPAGLHNPITSRPGANITGWYETTSPKLNGTPLPLAAREISRSLAFAPDGGFLIGADWHLYAFDPTGAQRWSVPVPGAVWKVNLNLGGAVAVAACDDGSLRWYRMSDGEELLAFCLNADGKRWVLWTPSGYYACSTGGEDLIGWQVNRGKDQSADFFPASRFRSVCYRPDIVSKVLETLDEAAAIAALGQGSRPQAASLTALMPPVVTILSPAFGAAFSQGSVTLRASIRPPQGAGIDAVWAAVDGRRVDTRGIQVQAKEADGLGYSLEVPVPGRDCVVSVFAQSRSAVSEAASVRLVWAGGPQSAGFTIQPKLYLLAVGISAYKNPGFKLDYPAKDARDFCAAFVRQKTRLYRDVEVRLLTDAAATRDAVLDGLEWLEKQTTAKDVAVLFLAGHGINDEVGAYFYLPWNADLDRVKTTLIPSTDFQNTLAKLPGKTLFFLDSCHSGNVLKVKLRGETDPNRFINELSSAENGVVVFSASTGRQASQESPQWGNGAFTKAVVEGLDGRADFQHTGRVTLNMLDLYISERVKILTRGTQAPTTAKPNTVQDFPIAIVK